MTQFKDIEKKILAVKKLTSFLFHKHYCENDVEAIIKLFDNKLSWFGAGENEYTVGTEAVSDIFRKFAGMVPKCSIWDEEYHVIDVSPDVYICTGRAWIATDPSTNIYLCVHQRITAVFHWIDGTPYCCHIHISNPYSEMTQQDIGFPTQIGQHTYEYLHKCIEEHKSNIEEQTKLLEKLSFEDLLTGLFNRNKFNLDMQSIKNDPPSHLGIAAIDLNGLKQVNDVNGHRIGDSLICHTAEHISSMFAGKAYRIGGDEFVVIDTQLEEDAFQNAIATMKKTWSNMALVFPLEYHGETATVTVKYSLMKQIGKCMRKKQNFTLHMILTGKKTHNCKAISTYNPVDPIILYLFIF